MNEKEKKPIFKFELEKELLETGNISDIELSSLEKECIRLMADNHFMSPAAFLQAAGKFKF